MANIIRVKGLGHRRELIAAGAITPGMLVKQTTTTAVNVHATAGGIAEAAFAVEREQTGDGIDVAYATSDTVVYEIMERGTEVQALLAASAAAVVLGDYLESAGDGTLRKIAGLTDNTAGTANTTLQALADGTTYATDVAAIRNNFADLAAYHNLLKAGAIAIAREAVDNSGGGSMARIKVAVL